MAADRNAGTVENDPSAFETKGNSSIAPPTNRGCCLRSFIRWIFSVAVRLFTWYSIVTIIFRCPATPDLLTETSPKLCRPYFQARSVLSPHVAPYYNTYAAPYVDSARPYYELVEKNAVAPAAFYGKKYAAPRIARIQAVCEAQWEKQAQPKVRKVNQAVGVYYNKSLAPHIHSATLATTPYIRFAKENALHTYYTSVLPAYTALQPPAQRGYEVVTDFALNTAIPSVVYAGNYGIAVVNRKVWPKVKVLYVETVEPQILRIGERLGNYRDGKRLKSAEAGSATASLSTSFSSVPTSISSAATTSVSPTSTPSSATPVSNPLPEADQRQHAQKIVTHDLDAWQQKLTRAVEQGSHELEQKISEITGTAMQKAAVGRALLAQLEKTVQSESEALKSSIIMAVKMQYEEKVILASVRKAGVAVRNRAQAVRAWRLEFDEETSKLVAKAKEDTFLIIDHIRDLGLQEVGMRWAWTDAVSHNDWARYHQLKNEFSEWKSGIDAVVAAHPGLAEVRAVSEDIEGRAMAIAEDAARELASLKETGRWKLAAADASDDFRVRSPEELSSQGTESASSVVGSSTENSETVVSVTASADKSSTIGPTDDTTRPAIGESIVSAAQDSASTTAPSETPQSSSENIISSAKASVSSIIDDASDYIAQTSESDTTGTSTSLPATKAASASSAPPISSASSAAQDAVEEEA